MQAVPSIPGQVYYDGEGNAVMAFASSDGTYYDFLLLQADGHLATIRVVYSMQATPFNTVYSQTPPGNVTVTAPTS
jgi:hypothetical protein